MMYLFTTGLYGGLLRETLLNKSTRSSVTAVRAAILPPLKEPPQPQFNAGLPFFRGLVLDRLNLLPSRPFLHPPPPFPLKEPMADRGKAPPRNSSRYLSISEEWKGKSVCCIVCVFQLVRDVWLNLLCRLRRPHTVSRKRAALENSLIDQDAEGGFHHSLLPCTQPAVARRRSLRWRRWGGDGALGCYPGDDGFFHAGDDHSVPEPSQPPTKIKIKNSQTE